MAIVPCGSGNGSQDLFGLKAADVPQVILEDALLDRNLSGKVQMLHATTATDTKGFALGCGAKDRCLVNIFQLGFGKACFLSSDGIGDLLSRQCPTNEDDLTTLPLLIR